MAAAQGVFLHFRRWLNATTPANNVIEVQRRELIQIWHQPPPASTT
jgi:hypothetical protein